MDKYYKLAKLIKGAGKQISAPDEYNKVYSLERLLGHHVSDAHPEILEVEDDSGYRSIIIGDLRGSVSYDTKRLDNTLFHKGFVYLYSENCSYNEDGMRIWSKRNYPTADHLYRALRILAKGEYDYTEGRYFSLSLNDKKNFKETRAYLSEVVEKFADMAWADRRTAEEMVGIE